MELHSRSSITVLVLDHMMSHITCHIKQQIDAKEIPRMRHTLRKGNFRIAKLMFSLIILYVRIHFRIEMLEHTSTACLDVTCLQPSHRHPQHVSSLISSIIVLFPMACLSFSFQSCFPSGKICPYSLLGLWTQCSQQPLCVYAGSLNK